MATETCENCKRIIGELEQAYTWQNHILCKECYARLSNPTVAQLTPVDVHAPVILPPPQRSLVKSTLIVMATVILAVIVIIIGISLISKANMAIKTDYGRVPTTKANLKVLHSAVNQFKMDTGRFPTEEEGLSALIEQPTDVENYEAGGYLETTELPKDGWKHDFIYQFYPESGRPFVIISYGADGKEGGEGINADLFSTDPD